MTGVPPPEPVLTVGRLDCTYLVPRTHPDGDAAAWRVDAALRPRLTDACGEALGPLLDPADPSVWIIDRLTLQTSLPVGGDAVDLGRCWGAALARAMAAVLRGEVTEGVVRYRSRAAWLAAFVRDLLAGEGARPAYAALSGVLALPVGRAIVTAAEGQGVPVAEVWQVLAEEGAVGPVLARLPAADATAVWRACLTEAGPGAAPSPLAQAANRVMAAVRLAHPELSDPQRALHALGAVLVGPGASPEAAVHAVVSASPAGMKPAPPDGHDPAPPSMSPEGRRPGSPTILAQSRAAAASGPAPDGVLVASRYAGVVLLLPGLLAAGMHEVTARWPGRAAALRYRVLLRCLGPAALLAAGDSALLLAAGLDPAQASPEVALPPRAQVTTALRDALITSARVDAEAAYERVVVHGGSGPVRLTVFDGLWLDATPAQSSRFAASSDEASDADPCNRGDGNEGNDNRGHDNSGYRADLAYLGAGDDPDDLAWTLLAQVGIRLFARRLAGFGTAGIPHLAANVFGRGGVVATEAGGLEVLLEPPPLQVVLHLAGLDDQLLDVPWLGGPVRIRVRG